MDREIALQKSQQLKIAVDQIVREEYEMLLLREIFQGSLSDRLVFRGGTALRLAYGSPRFSDDLDFSCIEEITEEEFKAWAEKTARALPNTTLAEALRKYFTLLAQFKIKDPAVPKAFSIKIEISVRREQWKRDTDYTLKDLASEMLPVTVLAPVATLERIGREKESIQPPRVRDVFDLWFIGQQRGKTVPMDFSRFLAPTVRRDLYRLLALGQRRLIEPWLPKE